MKNIDFPARKVHIGCDSLATQHARCHKNITLRGGQAVPTPRRTLASIKLVENKLRARGRPSTMVTAGETLPLVCCILAFGAS